MRASAAMSHFSPMLWSECVRARYLVSAPTAHRHSLSTKCRARGAAARRRAPSFPDDALIAISTLLPLRHTRSRSHRASPSWFVRPSQQRRSVAPMNGFEHSDEHRPCFYSRTWERGAPFQAPNYSAYTVIIRGAPIKNMDGTSRQHPLQTARGAVGRCVGRQSDG